MLTQICSRLLYLSNLFSVAWLWLSCWQSKISQPLLFTEWQLRKRDCHGTNSSKTSRRFVIVSLHGQCIINMNLISLVYFHFKLIQKPDLRTSRIWRLKYSSLQIGVLECKISILSQVIFFFSVYWLQPTFLDVVWTLNEWILSSTMTCPKTQTLIFIE